MRYQYTESGRSFLCWTRLPSGRHAYSDLTSEQASYSAQQITICMLTPLILSTQQLNIYRCKNGQA
jgi:hypothetical protein